MASPAEAHREHVYSERMKRRRKETQSRLDGMYAILHGHGFGSETDDEWEDREIARHLTAAFKLLQLVHRSLK